MNIIRTVAVELSTIPAIAYKQKLLSAGGSGVRIIRQDREAQAVFTVDRRTGEGVPYGPVNADLFPAEAVEEAVDLTLGLPYSKRGKLSIRAFSEQKEQDDVTEADQEALDMVGSDEYEAIITHFCGKKNRMDFELMNKEFIQFASRSKVVRTMVAEGALEDDTVRFIVKSRAAHLAGKRDSLSDRETDALMETLDEINPRGAFKDLRAYLRRRKARA